MVSYDYVKPGVVASARCWRKADRTKEWDRQEDVVMHYDIVATAAADKLYVLLLRVVVSCGVRESDGETALG